MIGRRSTIGLALLCAFVFCAFAAQGVMAQVGTKAVNTTAVTCVETAEGFFEEAHCDNKLAVPAGKFEHLAIKNDVTTEIEVTTDKTKNNTTEATPAKLNGTLAGVATEVTCSKVASTSKEGKSLSFLHNVETEGKHTVTGTAQVNFTNCTVSKPGKCIIKEPLVVTAEAVGVEGLNGKNAMGVEFAGEGAEKTFAELSFENKGEEKCSLLNGGKAFRIKGSVISTSNVAQGNKHNGSTAVYEDANEMETLEVGLKKVSFAGTFTTRMAGAGGNPISATTVT